MYLIVPCDRGELLDKSWVPVNIDILMTVYANNTVPFLE